MAYLSYILFFCSGNHSYTFHTENDNEVMKKQREPRVAVLSDEILLRKPMKIYCIEDLTTEPYLDFSDMHMLATHGYLCKCFNLKVVALL